MGGRHEADFGFAALAAWSHEVRAAIKRLDPTQGRILQMIYFERRSHAEVARELELPRRTVARSLAIGMQTLAIGMTAANAD